MNTLTRSRGPASGSGPWVHNKGVKAEKDRVVLLHSYREMCRVFRLPKARRLSERDLAIMTNTQIYQASKDLYNSATVRQARRLAVRLGITPRSLSVAGRLMAWARDALSGFRVDSGRGGAHA